MVRSRKAGVTDTIPIGWRIMGEEKEKSDFHIREEDCFISGMTEFFHPALF